MAKEKKFVEVVIETPRGCRNKYVYDEKEKSFRLKKILPAGAVFPFDFGFIPGTKGGDGDPLDVLVMMDEPAFTGCRIRCRIIGILKAEQQEKDGKKMENDRLVAVPEVTHLYKHAQDINDLDRNILAEIEHFFVSYNEIEGKKFIPMGWAGSEKAMELIEKAKK